MSHDVRVELEPGIVVDIGNEIEGFVSLSNLNITGQPNPKE